MECSETLLCFSWPTQRTANILRTTQGHEWVPDSLQCWSGRKGSPWLIPWGWKYPSTFSKLIWGFQICPEAGRKDAQEHLHCWIVAIFFYTEIQKEEKIEMSPFLLALQSSMVRYHLHFNRMAGVKIYSGLHSHSSHCSLFLFIGLTRHNLSNSIERAWKIIGPSGKCSRRLPKPTQVLWEQGAGRRPGWELLKAQEWGCQHWSSCSTHSCTQGTWKTAATMQHRLPDLNFLSGEKSRSSGKCLRRKFVSLQTGSQGR